MIHRIKKQLYYLFEGVVAWCFYLIFFMIGIHLASALGGFIARHLGPYLRASKIAERNLKFAMPELSAAERKKIIADMWDNLGRVVAELPHVRELLGKRFSHHVSCKGLEHLIRLREEKGTGIVFSAHQGNWEIAALSTYQYDLDATYVYRPANNPYVEQLIRFSRRYMKRGGGLHAKGTQGARAIVSTLKNQGFVGILVDQKSNTGVPLQFFGHTAMTAPSLAHFALKFHCSILPLQLKRKKGPYFEIIFHPPIPIGGRKPEDIMQEVNDMIEGWIRECPSQWLWVHNRWPKPEVHPQNNPLKDRG